MTWSLPSNDVSASTVEHHREDMDQCMTDHDARPIPYSTMPEIRELSDLAGSELSAICFVRDYVELHFDGTILRSLSDPVVVTSAGRSCVPEDGSRDAL